MDAEALIAQQVAQNIPRDEPAPISAPQDNQTMQEAGPSAFDSNVALNDIGLLTRIQDYFDVSRLDRYNEDTQKQLRNVYSWAADLAQSTDLDKVLPVIRALENELGVTFRQDKLQRLAKFVHLKKQSDVLQHQMGALRGPV